MFQQGTKHLFPPPAEKTVCPPLEQRVPFLAERKLAEPLGKILSLLRAPREKILWL